MPGGIIPGAGGPQQLSAQQQALMQAIAQHPNAGGNFATVVPNPYAGQNPNPPLMTPQQGFQWAQQQANALNNKPDPMTAQQIMKAISGYNYSQEMNPTQASSLAQSLAQEIGNLSPADAKKVLSQISGTTLGTDVQNILSGGGQKQQQYPSLSLGNMFSQAIAPFLLQQENIGNQEVSQLGAAAQKALSGASPGMQAAYGPGMKELQAAIANQNQADTTAVATGGEFDQMLQQIQNLTNAYKAAQGAAIYEPFVAQSSLGTAIPQGGTASAGQNILNQYLTSLNPGQTVP